MNPLSIQIPKPCQEVWDEMPLSGEGRFCSNCSNTVIDFSKKTDAEILQYFRTHKNICGRFRNHQLKRPIQAKIIPYKPSINIPSKIAACVFTFLSIKSTAAQAPSKKPLYETITQTHDEKFSGECIIEGTVTDDENKIVAGADVFFNNSKVATSDENGYYKISLMNPILRSQTVSFSKENYRNAVFSYHPLMGNTKHNVELFNFTGKVFHYGFTMGAPLMPHFPDVHLGKVTLLKGRKLKSPLRKELGKVAQIMRQNPMAEVDLTYYYPNQKKKQSYVIDAHQVVNYLVDRQGIDRDRFHFTFVRDKAKDRSMKLSNYHQH